MLEPIPASSPKELEQSLADLRSAADAWREAPPAKLRAIAKECLRGVVRMAPQWVAAGLTAKSIEPGSAAEAEEWLVGPVATARCLRLLIDTLYNLEHFGKPQLPGKPRRGHLGNWHVPVFPCRGLFDGVFFRGFSAEVRLQSGVTPDAMFRPIAVEETRAESNQSLKRGLVRLVLGAGNVGSIPATDSLFFLFQQREAVLLKMNPVNEYLGPIFAEIFHPLVERRVLRVVYGGAEVGSVAAHHSQVDAVHITGSLAAHEAIVWGADGEERTSRKQRNEPLLTKPITSELGNVTPWIVVPAAFSDAELTFQAKNLAASIVNNASFNCIATKMIVTWRGWSQRAEFLNRIEECLQAIPPRVAYYPGAWERYQKFAGQECAAAAAQQFATHRTLPWTIIRDVTSASHPLLFQEESFCAVVGETALDAATPQEFVERIADFTNQQLWGTLAATVVVHPKFRQQPGNEARLQRVLADLNYGTVVINHWAALAYAMISPPWGGAPGGTLMEPASGLGWVHNTYRLHGIEKTIVEGPLTLWPKPLWFHDHRHVITLAKQVLKLYASPAAWRLLPMMWPAVRG